MAPVEFVVQRAQPREGLETLVSEVMTDDMKRGQQPKYASMQSQDASKNSW